MTRRLVFSAAVMMAALLPDGVRADAVYISDGDSFRLGDMRYRLQGIDAPELHQECKDHDGKNWPCGIRARAELRRLIGTRPVDCKAVTIDRFGRVVATCSAGSKDLAEEMVRSGYATIFTRPGVTSPYEAAQAEARTEKRGIWAGTFEIPSDWRRSHPRDEVPPSGPPDGSDWISRVAPQVWQWLKQKLGY